MIINCLFAAMDLQKQFDPKEETYDEQDFKLFTNDDVHDQVLNGDMICDEQTHDNGEQDGKHSILSHSGDDRQPADIDDKSSLDHNNGYNSIQRNNLGKYCQICKVKRLGGRSRVLPKDLQLRKLWILRFNLDPERAAELWVKDTFGEGSRSGEVCAIHFPEGTDPGRNNGRDLPIDMREPNLVAHDDEDVDLGNLILTCVFCNAQRPVKSMIPFARTRLRRRQWIVALSDNDRRTENGLYEAMKNGATKFLCDWHFADDCFSINTIGEWKLKKDATPDPHREENERVAMRVYKIDIQRNMDSRCKGVNLSKPKGQAQEKKQLDRKKSRSTKSSKSTPDGSADHLIYEPDRIQSHSEESATFGSVANPVHYSSIDPKMPSLHPEEAGLQRKNQKYCALCGRTADKSSMKQMNAGKKLNLIMMASLSLIGVVDRADVATKVEEISKHTIFICHSHVVRAAQYLSAEMAANGKRFSYYKDPSAKGSTSCVSYVKTADIPPHLVEVINGMSNKTVIITARDVWSFMNIALKKYHGSSMWPMLCKEQAQFDQLPAASGSNIAAGVNDVNNVEMADECDEDDVMESGNIEVSNIELSSDDTERFCVVCKKTASGNFMKQMSWGKKLNLIITASLSLIGVVERANVADVVEEVSKHSNFICHCHVVQAAQYLFAEVAATGKRFLDYKDLSVRGNFAYTNTADIPPRLVEMMNRMSDRNITIMARDVWSFMNIALKKYHGTSLWLKHNEEQGATGQGVSMLAPGGVANDMEMAEGCDENNEMGSLGNNEVSEMEPSCSDSTGLHYKQKRCCAFCGRMAEGTSMKQMSSGKKLNLVMMASLSLIGYVDRTNVATKVEELSHHSKYICHSHVVQAAQYLSAEMAAAGRRFSYFYDPAAKGSTAYVNTADIPPHLVEIISGMSDDRNAITARDVFLFINSALKKYHGTPLWPEHCGEEEALEDTESPQSAPHEPFLETRSTEELDGSGGVETPGHAQMCEIEPCSSVSTGVRFKQKRYCAFCGRAAESTCMKQMGSGRKLNLILTASLSLLGYVDKSNVVAVVEEISNHNKYICHSHVVQTAQYLSAEMAASGRHFSYYDDPSARGSTAYVNTTDIPPHLVKVINGMSSGSNIITARDVFLFMNSALKKYHGTSWWPEHYGKEEESKDTHPDQPAPPPEPIAGADLIVGSGMSEIEHRDPNDEMESSSSNAEVFEQEPNNCNSKSSLVSLSEYVGETDSATMQKCFIVEGEMLMKLFRFCPDCGQRLAKARLKAVGTAAVVVLACQKCAVKPLVKREKQNQVQPTLRERMDKEMVVASVMAVGKGPRCVEPARWVEQMNRSVL
ncbi:hypothetical protein GCK32_000860 [Trichostrongylus colubriformis]|uniref:THAP-type domain-containing protein n=1 Tax=Trichostrongylus colubriformis TaxID=6319 RepID=A0AAN8FF80_TRICO